MHMATSLKWVTIALIYIVTVQATCKKRIDCDSNVYSFNINATVRPDQDSINVNDTIWIELSESVNLKDNASGNTINYSNAENLGTAIGFTELLGNSQDRNAANEFNYMLLSGKEVGNSNVNLFREYIFDQINSSFVFKLGIIPKRRGVFRISLSSATNVFRKGDKCTKASFTLNFKETNQHLYYNEWNYGVSVPLPNNGYCFKVR